MRPGSAERDTGTKHQATGAGNGGGMAEDWRARLAAEAEARRPEVRALPTVELEPRGRLTAPLDGDELVHLSVSPHGDPVALWARPADRAEQLTKDIAPNGVGFPRTQLARPVTMRFVTYRPEPVVTSLETALAVPYAQPLSGGRVLVVGARCAYRGEEGPERNAEVHDSGGRLLASGTLGDGISYVRTDPGDGIWVGYHEEGIYGNFGWGEPQGPRPIGAHGVVRFTDALTVDQPLPAVAPWQLPATGSRLALEGTAAWLSFDNGGTRVVVRFDPDGATGHVDGWALDEASPCAAVPLSGGRAVVLVGGRRGEHDVLTRAGLADGLTHPGPRFRLSLPGGAELGRYTWYEHGGTLHVFTDTAWWTVDLDRDLDRDLSHRPGPAA